jgi:glyoxylase-like metal-dependent hydrolase (beta-lactamase superfamily II)
MLGARHYSTAGCIRIVQHDPAARLGARLAGLFRIGIQPGDEVSARLAAIDRDPATWTLIANSHFHFDHFGANALIPDPTMLVQRWDAGMNPDTAARHRFNPRDFDLGHKLCLFEPRRLPKNAPKAPAL